MCTIRGSHLSEEHKRKISLALQGRPGTHHTEETKRRISCAKRGSHHTEASKQKISLTLTGYKRSDETCREMSEAQKGHVVSEEQRKILAIVNKGNRNAAGHKVPESAKAIISAVNKGNTYRRGKKFSEESKKKVSDSMVGKKHPHKGHEITEHHRKILSERHKGKRNVNWKGGISNLPYCPKFNNELKESIREEFGRRCFLCGVLENGYKLHVHHVDYNKGQGCGQRWSLVPLCRSCHTKTTNHRFEYFNLLSNYWAYKYMDWGTLS